VQRRLLVIDDDPTVCELLDLDLSRRKYSVVTHTSPEAALEQLATEDFGVVISDINMGGITGVELCRRVVALREDTPVIVMTAYASVESAVASIRAGAYDFVTKPFESEELALTIERALKHRELHEEVKRLRSEVNERRPFDEIVGGSSVMKRVYELITRVADTEATVLVTGDSGTGK
jgi:DNA-binding NtrC family response regulator